MAERLPGGNEQAMQQVVNQSPWEHEPIQHQLAHFLAKKLNVQKGVLVLDDTSLPKKGKASVGVARQYCGALGKVSNCQSIVTWHYTQEQGEHFPVIGELFLPERWINDTHQLVRCGVPEHRFTFKKKGELAYELLETLPREALLYEAIVFDAGYGEIREFLRRPDQRGDIFVAQILESHSFWPLDMPITTQQAKRGRPRQYGAIADKPLSAIKWRMKLEQEGMKWQRVELSLTSKKTNQRYGHSR